MAQPFRFALSEEDIPEDGNINIELGYPKNEANPHRKPLAYQKRFHNSDKKYRLMSGRFGTGGTTALAIECVYQSLTYPNNVGLLGRHNSVELESTTLTELLDILPTGEDGEMVCKAYKKDLKWIIPLPINKSADYIFYKRSNNI